MGNLQQAMVEAGLVSQEKADQVEKDKEKQELDEESILALDAVEKMDTLMEGWSDDKQATDNRTLPAADL